MRQFILKPKESSPLRLVEEGVSAGERSEATAQATTTGKPLAPSASAGTEERAPTTTIPEPTAAQGASPGVAGTAPATPESESRTTASHPSRRGERCYVVSYAGRFIGFFEAEDVIKPREAFLYVARELASRGPFEPEDLSLHKPVLIRRARPPKGSAFVRGRLARVEGTPPGAPVASGEPSPPEAGAPVGAIPEPPARHQASGGPVFIDDPIVCLDEPAPGDAIV